ncbi:MAG: glutathione synthase [Rickettsiaceae bacterium]|nr:glutathione synthase [Rickettsiaceae bacterium]
MNKNNKICIAIQADPLHDLKTKSDSTLLIAAELCSRGYRTFFYTPQNLFVQDNICFAKGDFAMVEYTGLESTFTLGENSCLNLDEVSAVLIRQDPPFDMNYITNTYLLDRVNPKVLVINNPSSIRSHSEKIMTLKFAEFIHPSMIISSLHNEAIEFIKEHKQVVIKPLYWFGGKYLEFLECDNTDDIGEKITLSLQKHQHIIIQKFLQKVYEGDKRIIIIDGKAIAVIKRIPQSGNFIANLATGGTATKTEITQKEHKIIDVIGPYLKSQGIIFAGVDMIDEYLIEINITSPTGLVAIEQLYDLNLAGPIVDYIEKRI